MTVSYRTFQIMLSSLQTPDFFPKYRHDFNSVLAFEVNWATIQCGLYLLYYYSLLPSAAVRALKRCSVNIQLLIQIHSCCIHLKHSYQHSPQLQYHAIRRTSSSPLRCTSPHGSRSFTVMAFTKGVPLRSSTISWEVSAKYELLICTRSKALSFKIQSFIDNVNVFLTSFSLFQPSSLLPSSCISNFSSNLVITRVCTETSRTE